MARVTQVTLMTLMTLMTQVTLKCKWPLVIGNGLCGGAGDDVASSRQLFACPLAVGVKYTRPDGSLHKIAQIW